MPLITWCYHKKRRIKGFNKRSRQREFQLGYLVLLWNKIIEEPGKHGKFEKYLVGAISN